MAHEIKHDHNSCTMLANDRCLTSSDPIDVTPSSQQNKSKVLLYIRKNERDVQLIKETLEEIVWYILVKQCSKKADGTFFGEVSHIYLE
jgi:hypothetical protein